jgi:hypothetical protein
VPEQFFESYLALESGRVNQRRMLSLLQLAVKVPYFGDEGF